MARLRGGRGCYKSHFPHFRSSTLEEESDVRGLGQRGSRRPPHRLEAPVFTNRRLFLSTDPSWLSLKTNLPLPRLLNAKRQRARTHSRQGTRRSGGESSDKHAGEKKQTSGSSPLPFSMHTLCARGTMKPEINAAVGFLSRFLRVKGHVNDRQVQTFNQSLQDILAGKKTRQLRTRAAENTHQNHPTRQIARLLIKSGVGFEDRSRYSPRKPSQERRSLFSNYRYQRGRRAAALRT